MPSYLNPCVTFTDVNNDGIISPAHDILESKTLYPFGMHAFGTRAAGHERSLQDFTGHDLSVEGYQGVHDMKARQYISGLGVFGGVDPLASSFPSYTPYHYVHNNPINLIDPTGMSAETTIVGDNGDGTYTVKDWVNDGKTDVVTEGGVKIGNSLTTHSFVDDNDKVVAGAVINMESSAGQDFIDQSITGANNGEGVGTVNYMNPDDALESR